MKGLEALNFIKWYIAQEDIRKEIDDITVKERIGIIQKDLKDFEELKNPIDEYETDKYLVHREAFWSDMAECLMYGYTVYEWKGDYYEKEIPILKKSMKFKKWEKILHSTGSEKIELNDEYIQHVLKIKEIARGK